MLGRSLRALLVATAVILAPTGAFACLGAYETWLLARVDETLAAAKLPAGELAEGRKLRDRAAGLMTEHRYEAARQLLDRAVKILHLEFEDDKPGEGVPTLGAEPGCGVLPKV